jgi:hypothetical protein
MKQALAGILATWSVCVSMAFAQEDGAPEPSAVGGVPSAAIEFERFHFDHVIEANGEYEVTSDLVLKPLTEQAVKGAAQLPLPFREDVSSLDIIHAYTQKSDGRRIDVAADRIMLMSAPFVAQAPVFSTIKMKVVIFPDVAVGDRLFVKAKIKMREPDFPGQFASSHVLARATIYRDVRLSFTYPRAVRLRFDARQLTEQPETQQDGRVNRSWTFANFEAQPVQPGSVDRWDYDPRLIASTFPDWKTLAASYEDRAKPMSQPSAAVRAKADEITKGLTDPRAQAKALYEWVALNIRYVGVYLGAGGFVPHSAGDVLTNRYGDCKDHVVLLEALLAAKGIESSAVLIHSAPRFEPSALPVPGQFNHAITWIPSLNLYLDSTSRYLQFGVLNEPLYDKPILRTRGGTTLERSPKPTARGRSVSSQLSVIVAADGNASGEQSVTGTGSAAAMIRARLATIDSSQAQRGFLSAMLRSAGLVGTAEVSKDDATVLDDDYSFRIKFQANDWFNTASDGAFLIPSGWFSPTRIANAQSRLGRPPERVNEACGPITVEERAKLDLPASIKIGALPKPVKFIEPAVTYEAMYELSGSSIVATRKIVLLAEHGSCTPTEMAAHRRMADVVRKDLRTQVVYTVRPES